MSNFQRTKEIALSEKEYLSVTKLEEDLHIYLQMHLL